MKNNTSIPKNVISRLPRYYRFLGMLLDEGLERISSGELSSRMGLTASQIRQDLNHFGGFGQQGYGYNVVQLRENIGHIIGIDNYFKVILVGVGNLGKAIAQHLNFQKRGFELIGIFDSDKSLAGTEINNTVIKDFDKIAEFCEKHNPTAAILCIPSSAGKAVTEKLVECNIKAFWNFSHYSIADDFPDTIVENVHLNDSLMTLCYNITNSEELQ